jgi:cytochrome c5
MKNLLVLMLCISGAGLVACGSEDDTDEGADESSGDGDNGDNGDGDNGGEVDCTGDLPTYDDFGKDFVDEYCSSCHGGDVMGADRMSAPTAYVFDTLEQIQDKADEMAYELAIGAMPFGDDSLKPSDEDRAKAVTWLSCDPK